MAVTRPTILKSVPRLNQAELIAEAKDAERLCRYCGAPVRTKRNSRAIEAARLGKRIEREPYCSPACRIKHKRSYQKTRNGYAIRSAPFHKDELIHMKHASRFSQTPLAARLEFPIPVQKTKEE